MTFNNKNDEDNINIKERNKNALTYCLFYGFAIAPALIGAVIASPEFDEHHSCGCKSRCDIL
jgi:hypothetical protein